MIVGKIIGGLGNQMFQYSFYKYLSVEKKCNLKLDLSSFDNYKLHNGYELKTAFGINESIATMDELNELKSKYSLYFKLENRIFNKNHIFGRKHFKENKFYIDKNIFGKDVDDFYVEGYFQTYKYIQNLAFDIFEFQTTLTNMEKNVLQGEAISIHVRGGDYITSKADNTLFGNICTKEYYERAIRYIKDSTQNPYFLIFTNDREYAEKLLIGENVQFIDWNTEKNSYRDMYLMSQCKHNIIANSSFSWWGAWLNNNLSKIVIAPHKWFNDYRIKQDKIVPQNWIRLDS